MLRRFSLPHEALSYRAGASAVAGVLGLLLFLQAAPDARAAVIFLEARDEVLQQGDVVMVPLRIDTEDACVNAVEVQIRYDRDVLSAIDVSRGRSILSLWTETPEIDKEKGRIRFSGGIPGGYCGRVTGDPGLTNILADIAFLVKGAARERQEALVSVDFTRVYAHDGRGTLLPTTAKPVALTVAPSLARPVLDEWLERVREDDVAPELFSIVLNNDPSVARGKYYIVFSTTDKQSGIDHYEVRETDPKRWGFLSWIGREARWVVAESPYVLRDQSLNSTIQVKAVDKAGNERVVNYHPPAELARTPYLLFLMWGLGILLLGGASFFAARHVMGRWREGYARGAPAAADDQKKEVQGAAGEGERRASEQKGHDAEK